MAAVNKSNQEE